MVSWWSQRRESKMRSGTSRSGILMPCKQVYPGLIVTIYVQCGLLKAYVSEWYMCIWLGRVVHDRCGCLFFCVGLFFLLTAAEILTNPLYSHSYHHKYKILNSNSSIKLMIAMLCSHMLFKILCIIILGIVLCYTEMDLYWKHLYYVDNIYVFYLLCFNIQIYSTFCVSSWNSTYVTSI